MLLRIYSVPPKKSTSMDIKNRVFRKAEKKPAVAQAANVLVFGLTRR